MFSSVNCLNSCLSSGCDPGGGGELRLFPPDGAASRAAGIPKAGDLPRGGERRRQVDAHRGGRGRQRLQPRGRRTYTVNDIAAILGIGRASTYKLANSGAFKTIRIGNMIRISRKSFENWLKAEGLDDETE